MDILKIIKNRKTIRKYKNKQIPKNILTKIIEAGIWGPSIMGVQPWKFVISKDKKLINKIYKILCQNSQQSKVGSRFIFFNTANAINEAKIIIGVYNTKSFTNKMRKFGKMYLKFAYSAEIESIAASIQNMLLTAESLGIGTAWLDTPLVFEDKINKIFQEKNSLVALLTLGYPKEKVQRAPRKPLVNFLRYI